MLEDTEANERVPDSMPNKSTHDSSEDENEIDLRERLLREKAIKSMRNRRQLSQQDELQTTSSNDRIVFQT